MSFSKQKTTLMNKTGIFQKLSSMKTYIACFFLDGTIKTRPKGVVKVKDARKEHNNSLLDYLKDKRRNFNSRYGRQ